MSGHVRTLLVRYGSNTVMAAGLPGLYWLLNIPQNGTLVGVCSFMMAVALQVEMSTQWKGWEVVDGQG